MMTAPGLGGGIGGVAMDLGLGGQLQQQVIEETEEQRRRRMQQQQQQRLTGTSPMAASSLGLTSAYANF